MHSKQRDFALSLTLFLALTCGVSHAQTGQTTLSWNAPTTNMDGTPLTDLAGYKVYYGQTSGSYSTIIDVGNQTDHTLTGLTVEQPYYFAIKAYDSSGSESPFSSEIVYTLLAPADTDGDGLSDAEEVLVLFLLDTLS